MKKFSYLIVFFLFSACENSINPDSELETEWRWLGSSGGFAGHALTPASTGDEILIEFASGRYRKYTNGSLTQELRYKLKLEESIFSTEPTEIINYSNDWRQSFMVREDTLFLSDECYDCYFHTYIRLEKN